VRRKNLATFCLLTAWLCATGAVSNVAQVFAWGRMFVGYTRALSVSEALTETFDASKPCALCLAVKKSRDAENNQPRAAEFSAEKLLLSDGEPEPIVFIPKTDEWPAAGDWRGCARIETVPVRPPRA
jgi:hypothetical protein